MVEAEMFRKATNTKYIYGVQNTSQTKYMHLYTTFYKRKKLKLSFFFNELILFIHMMI